MADRIVVLRSGVVQQTGSPEDVYGHPVNPFVADFMGYRNQLTMKGEPSTAIAGTTRVSGHGIALVTEGVSTGEVTIAIKPDDVALGRTGENSVEGVVRSVEYQGRDHEVQIEIGPNVTLFARWKERVAIGDHISVNVPRDRIMVYPEVPAR